MARIWTTPFFQSRNSMAFRQVALPKLLRRSRNGLKKFTRIDSQVFDYILRKLRPAIKRMKFIRKPISAREKLLLTLRHLASGDSFASLSYLFRISRASIRLAVKEVCNAILRTFGAAYLHVPNSTGKWKRIATEFGEKWQLENCLGVIDSKHIRVDKPRNSGSVFFNRKNFCSFHLLAIVDASYKFQCVEVGREGSQCDAAVWKQSAFKAAMDRNRLRLPRSKRNGLPFVFIGDGGFPISERLMIPFRRNQLHYQSYKRRIFNYRLCRARRLVENVFGIMTHRFRLFRLPMNVDVEFAKLMTTTACVLHNMLVDMSSNYIKKADVDQERKRTGDVIEGAWRASDESSSSSQTDSDTEPEIEDAAKLRIQFAEFFYDRGAVAFQWNFVRKWFPILFVSCNF